MNEIIALLDKFRASFPADELEDIYALYLWWDDTFRLALEVGGSDASVDELNELISEFWTLFRAESDKDEFWQRIKRIRVPLLLRLPERALSPDEEAMLNELNAAAYACVSQPRK